jgi:hypothetical protein
MSANEALERAEVLLDRLDAARERLATVEGEQAIEVLQELVEIAKQIEAELQRAHQVAGADAAGA